MAQNIRELSEKMAAYQKILINNLEALKKDIDQKAQEMGKVKETAEEAKKS